MDNEIEKLVQAIHDSATRMVMVTAGAGTQALAWLQGVAGASRTLLEALVPYAATSFSEFLGQVPAQYVAQETASMLAGRALTRARWLREEGERVIGLACTATLVTDRPKRGEHRAHIATWESERICLYSLGLEKGARDRRGEEEMVSRLMLNVVARAHGLEDQLPLALLAGDQCAMEETNLAQAVQRLRRQQSDLIGVDDNGCLLESQRRPATILSGAFNPLHAGHLGLAQVASEVTGHPVAFELAAVNVDKPPLSEATVLDRMAQFAGRWPIYASNAPTFVAKARLFPGVTFVVGYDTAVRVLQPRYYDGSEAQMAAALEEIRRQGCRFLVAGRVDANEQFHDARELATPPAYAELFQPIPSGRFRADISSTQLRLAGERGSR